MPLLIGSAERGNGITRLLKALRHEAPDVAATRRRLGIADSGPPLAHTIRTIHTAHGGKLSLARVLRGAFSDGMTVISSQGREDRIAGLSRLIGATASKQPKVEEGDTLAFGRLESVVTGDSFSEAKSAGTAAVKPALPKVAPPPPVHTFALSVKDRKDEVRLTTALAKLIEEDPSLVFLQDQESGEMKLLGQGEMHLRVALERLAARFGVTVDVRKPLVAYRETIRDQVSVRGRHKKQSGGHGQFGDVVLEVRPLARGEGFVFAETVHGGAVPRNYFSSVEIGCRDGLSTRPARFSGRRCRGDIDRRFLSCGRFLRHGLPCGGETRHGRGPAEGAAGAARTDPCRRDQRAERSALARVRHRLGPARPNPRL